jgi:hypothetical protein
VGNTLGVLQLLPVVVVVAVVVFVVVCRPYSAVDDGYKYEI